MAVRIKSEKEPATRTRRDESSPLDCYFREIQGFSPLKKEREHDLARRIQLGETGAVNELVESNLRFVFKVAQEYKHLGVPVEDLVNEGNLGLIVAAKRFTPEKDTKFSTYGVWWVRKAIRKALNEQKGVVREPEYQYKLRKKMREVEKNLKQELQQQPERREIAERLERNRLQELGQEPKQDEISRRLALQIEKVDHTLHSKVRSISIETPTGKSRAPIHETLEDRNEDSSPLDSYLNQELDRETEDILQMLNELDEREATVIVHRFGLNGEQAKTHQQIGDMLGISRERTRQIEGKALKDLRELHERKKGILARK